MVNNSIRLLLNEVPVPN